MSYRTKSWLGVLMAFPLFMYVWLVLVAGWLMRTQPGLPVTLGAMFGTLLFFNIVFFGYTATFIKCPKCGVRFGPKMYSTGPFIHPWPRRICWNCGTDMVEAENAQEK